MARLQSDLFAAEQAREARDRLEDAIRQSRSFARKPADPAAAKQPEGADAEPGQFADEIAPAPDPYSAAAFEAALILGASAPEA